MKRTLPRLKIICILSLAAAVLCPQPQLSAGEAKQATTKASSPHFFAYDDIEYFTSADKRIGAKIMADPAKTGPTMSSLTHLTFLPGAHVLSHRHVYVTEVIYVLSGALTVKIGGEIKVLGPDSTAFIPPQTFHEFLNDSADVVKFLQYFSPSGPEEEYRNWARPNDPESGEQQKQEPKRPIATITQVITPPLPAVPGSPHTVIGGVVEATASESASKDVSHKKLELQTSSGEGAQ